MPKRKTISLRRINNERRITTFLNGQRQEWQNNEDFMTVGGQRGENFPG